MMGTGRPRSPLVLHLDPARSSAPAKAKAPAAEKGTVTPRLLDLHQAAEYLGVSYWTMRDYTLERVNGDPPLIQTVRLPGYRPREGERAKQTLYRTLIDREDLDRFIERHKGK